jgi:hypothetical protein
MSVLENLKAPHLPPPIIVYELPPKLTKIFSKQFAIIVNKTAFTLTLNSDFPFKQASMNSAFRA